MCELSFLKGHRDSVRSVAVSLAGQGIALPKKLARNDIKFEM